MVNITEYTVPLHLELVPMIMAELSATTVVFSIQSIVIQSYHTIYIKHGSKKKCQNRSLSSLIQVHINSYSNMNSTGREGQPVSIISPPCWVAIKGGLDLLACEGPLELATEETEGVLMASWLGSLLNLPGVIEGGGGSASTKPGLIVTLFVQSCLW